MEKLAKRVAKKYPQKDWDTKESRVLKKDLHSSKYGQRIVPNKKRKYLESLYEREAKE